VSQVSDLGAPRRDHDPSPRDFEDWVLATAPRMRRLAFLLTGDLDTAPDLLQSAYAKVLPRWDHVAAMGSPEAYLYRVMVNLRTSWWRRYRNREYAVSEVPESAWGAGRASDTDRDLDRVVESQRLLAALKAMPERQRVTVVLRYYCDLSEPQTAETMHCSLGTVKSNASRGLAQLRRLLADELADHNEIEK
jgi:RNA polymerase sigma-70 factor (sigma-E family)